MIRVIRVKQLSGTPYMALAIGANHQMIVAGQADREVCQIHWEDSAVVALDEGVPIGIIVYTPFTFRQELMIKLGFVTPTARRQHIYSQLLWPELVKIAQEGQFPRISSAVKVDNLPLRNLAQQQGRIEESINLVYLVPTL